MKIIGPIQNLVGSGQRYQSEIVFPPKFNQHIFHQLKIHQRYFWKSASYIEPGAQLMKLKIIAIEWDRYYKNQTFFWQYLLGCYSYSFSYFFNNIKCMIHGTFRQYAVIVVLICYKNVKNFVAEIAFTV